MQRIHGFGRARGLITALLTVGALAVAGCTIGDDGSGVASHTAASTSPLVAPTLNPSASASRSAPPSRPAPPEPALAASFKTLVAQTDATVGVAVAPVGGGPGLAFGAAGDVAWSTSKVPLAIAASVLGPSVQADTRSAIIESDNAAAQRLWERLGGGRTAAAKVQAVLRADGDQQTTVNPFVTRPGYTAFGQTVWTYANQAAFAAHLPCDPKAAPILQLMQDVDTDQHWGVQQLFDGSAVKGGWGPTTDGRYYVRQLAVLDRGQRKVAVSIGILAPDFGSGQTLLDTVGAWVHANFDRLPTGSCPA
ncbi:serine hydrolase [Tsukamurella soli]|uniref:Beta-lactamase class A n=1 Tax=Tsukamurella soli TaxID=644556 RepID=A0ABP8K654_9ACTN